MGLVGDQHRCGPAVKLDRVIGLVLDRAFHHGRILFREPMNLFANPSLGTEAFLESEATQRRWLLLKVYAVKCDPRQRFLFGRTILLSGNIGLGADPKGQN